MKTLGSVCLVLWIFALISFIIWVARVYIPDRDNISEGTATVTKKYDIIEELCEDDHEEFTEYYDCYTVKLKVDFYHSGRTSSHDIYPMSEEPDYSDALAVYKKYNIGDNITIYYDATEPHEYISIYPHNINSHMILILAIFIIGLLILLVISLSILFI